MAVLLDVKRVTYCRITPVLAVLLFAGYAAAQSRLPEGAHSPR
jgi:membrane-associated phospholipid phosphatase